MLCRWICILIVGAVQIQGFSTSFTISRYQKFSPGLKNSCSFPRFSTLPVFKVNGLQMDADNQEPSEKFPEKESYSEQEVEELVTKAEKLWEKALEARKLAEDLSVQAENLADEIESKVFQSMLRTIQQIISENKLILVSRLNMSHIPWIAGFCSHHAS